MDRSRAEHGSLAEEIPLRGLVTHFHFMIDVKEFAILCRLYIKCPVQLTSELSAFQVACGKAHVGGRHEGCSEAAVERSMRMEEMILQALAKKIFWWQAAEIIGSDRQMRRWKRRYEL